MRRSAVLGLLLLSLSACGGGPRPEHLPGPGAYKLGEPYVVNGRWYRPYFDPGYRADGVASWYGDGFHGRPTANGEVFDKHRLTAAHTTLPLPSLVRVTNLENGRRMLLRVNDRGPFVDGRLIDVSQRAARELGFERKGLARVRVEFVGLADGRGTPPEPTWTPPPAPSWRTAAAISSGGPAVPDPGPDIPTKAELAAAADTAGRVSSPPQACPVPAAFIQVAAFTEPQRAEALALHLSRRHPTRVVAHRAGEITLSRVQLGPIVDGDKAGQVLDSLRAMGFDKAFVVAPMIAEAFTAEAAAQVAC